MLYEHGESMQLSYSHKLVHSTSKKIQSCSIRGIPYIDLQQTVSTTSLSKPLPNLDKCRHFIQKAPYLNENKPKKCGLKLISNGYSLTGASWCSFMHLLGTVTVCNLLCTLYVRPCELK